jgi:hypothetical protein
MLKKWQLEALEGFRFELAEITKIRGEVCPSIEMTQTKQQVHAA